MSTNETALTAHLVRPGGHDDAYLHRVAKNFRTVLISTTPPCSSKPMATPASSRRRKWCTSFRAGALAMLLTLAAIYDERQKHFRLALLASRWRRSAFVPTCIDACEQRDRGGDSDRMDWRRNRIGLELSRRQRSRNHALSRRQYRSGHDGYSALGHRLPLRAAGDAAAARKMAATRATFRPSLRWASPSSACSSSSTTSRCPTRRPRAPALRWRRCRSPPWWSALCSASSR